MREGVLPAVVMATAVIGFSGYFWLQGGSHVVDFAVVRSSVEVVDAAARVVPGPIRREVRRDEVLLVDVAWAAAEPVNGGAYFVLVAAPHRWRPAGCLPECDWRTTSDVQRFAASLPRSTFRQAAVFDADAQARVAVAFQPARGLASTAQAPPSFEPAAWLLQTDGDNVLGAAPIPVDR